MKTQTLFTRDEIAAAVKRTAAHVQAHFGTDEPVTVLVLLNGGMWFAADLLRELPANYLLETVRVSSYGAGTESSGELRWGSPCPEVAGRRVLVVDDVLDTGLTMLKLTEALRAQGARDVASCVAVNKTGRRSAPIEPDFAALQVENGFLLGYGMDWGGRYRNNPSIEVVIEP